MQNWTDNANGNVPLTLEMCDIFNFPWDQGAHMFIWKEKQSWSVGFLKIFLLSFLFLVSMMII